MGIVTTLKATLTASKASPDRRAESKGAHWCHDCGERIPDSDAEGDGPPDCPSCGEAMTFERSPDSAGCAC